MVCQRTGIRATGGRDFNLPLYLYLYLTNISVTDNDNDKNIYLYMVVTVTQRDILTRLSDTFLKTCHSVTRTTYPSRISS